MITTALAGRLRPPNLPEMPPGVRLRAAWATGNFSVSKPKVNCHAPVTRYPVRGGPVGCCGRRLPPRRRKVRLRSRRPVLHARPVGRRLRTHLPRLVQRPQWRGTAQDRAQGPGEDSGENPGKDPGKEQLDRISEL